MEGTPLAKCPLKEAQDQHNYLFLTDKNFVVRINNRQFIYDINSLRSISWSTKKLLFPIVAGGIMTSLSVLAYMNGFLHPLLLLFFFITGILSFYYGFAGMPALVLHFNKNQEHYLIKNTTLYLERFTDFVNKYLQQRRLPEYFLRVSAEKWKNAKETGFIRVSEPIRLYETIPEGDDHVILKLKVDSDTTNVTYIPSEENNGLIPCVTDNIPLTAIFQL
ncbi:MAG: hypothetical protein ACNS60_05115 [Candidatus Cyclobacteriaceae bacterium M2_1C_046]